MSGPRSAQLPVLEAAWPAPPGVHACTTLRAGGVSQGPYAGLNLGAHVDDEPAAVAANRARLQAALHLPGAPVWLDQVHGTTVVDLERIDAAPGATCADAAISRRAGLVCAVLTADCLPVFFSDAAGSCVAVAHAGWRGLAAGILEATVARMAVAPDRLLAWLGPAIGPRAFEVGAEVRTAFMADHPAAAAAFTPSAGNRWLADLYALARLRLAASGVRAVYGGGLCTYSDAQRFYSYRRDGQTGRMASLIWRTD